MKEALKISQIDNVAVVLEEVLPGEKVNLKDTGKPSIINATDKIPVGHKVSLKKINSGEKVIKYANPIGQAKEKIEKGNWVHTHNLKTSLKGKLNYNYQPVTSPQERCGDDYKFKGYRRQIEGKVGVRNEIWLINTVGCIDKITASIAERARDKFADRISKKTVEAIEFFGHPYGCSQMGSDLRNTQKLLTSLARHPNAGGVLICGLGCEDNEIKDMKEMLGDYNKDRIKFISFQDKLNEAEASLELIKELIDYASQFSRERIDISNLKIGMKCGGSDSFSGITANPLLGLVSNKLIDCGGISVLSEVPEMFGAEEILMQRAKDKRTYKKIVKMINDFKDYFIEHDKEIYENPSPGNIEGGITTLEEKSLGNIKKGGDREIVDVKRYGEIIGHEPGVHLLEAPGNDLVSTTALTAAGSHIILFTTGRGTPFGAPVPTVKISTNSELYDRKSHWMDYDAGRLVKGEEKEKITEEFFQLILDVCSGKRKALNEKNNFKEIAIFKKGVTV